MGKGFSRFSGQDLRRTKYNNTRETCPLLPSRVLKTLLLDDDPVDRDFFSNLAGKSDLFNLHIDEVGDVESGSEQLEQMQYDLFVIDFWLGNQTSVEFVMNVSEISPTTPIIILTSLDTSSIREIGNRANATSFLPKLDLNLAQLEFTLCELSSIH